MPQVCCVLNCKGRNRLRRFPSYSRDTDRFIRWVELTGNLKLLEYAPDELIKLKSVCSGHFEANLPSHSNLPKHFVPTLNLPAPIKVPWKWVYPNCDSSGISLGNVDKENARNNVILSEEITYPKVWSPINLEEDRISIKNFIRNNIQDSPLESSEMERFPVDQTQMDTILNSYIIPESSVIKNEVHKVTVSTPPLNIISGPVPDQVFLPENEVEIEISNDDMLKFSPKMLSKKRFIVLNKASCRPLNLKGLLPNAVPKRIFPNEVPKRLIPNEVPKRLIPNAVPENFETFLEFMKPTKTYSTSKKAEENQTSTFQSATSTFQPPTTIFQSPTLTFQPPISTHQVPISTFQQPISTFQPPTSTFQSSTLPFQPSKIRILSAKEVHDLTIKKLDESKKSKHVLANTRRRINIDPENPREVELKKIMQIKNKRIKYQNATISRLKRKIKTYKSKHNIETVLDKINFPSKFTKAFVKMQLFHRKNTYWSDDEREFAISLYRNSFSGYKFLSKNGFTLPATATVRLWIRASNSLPGS